jgi:hypothetical protein
LNPAGFNQGIFVILRGYLDDSKDGKTFNLTAVIADGGGWFYWEQDWLKVIEAKNEELISSGRKPISRYHATDCQFRVKEFKSWSVPEKDEFCKKLFSLFEKYKMHVIGYSIDVQQLVEEIPEAASSPERFCYVISLCYVMLEIGDYTLDMPDHRKEAVISLIHDRCDYNGAMLDMFDGMLADQGFKYRNRFTTLAPMGWEHCVPLQLADLMAYENFKESQRLDYRAHDPRRRSLDYILTYGQMGGRLRGFNPETLRELRKRIDEMPPESRQRVLGADTRAIKSRRR